MKNFFILFFIILFLSGISSASPFVITQGSYSNTLTGETYEISGTVDFIDHRDMLYLFDGTGLGILDIDEIDPLNPNSYPGTSYCYNEVWGLWEDHYDFFAGYEGDDVSLFYDGVANISSNSYSDSNHILYGVDVKDICFTLNIIHHSGIMYFQESYSILASHPVPEPATMILLGTGLVGLAGLRKKYKKA